MGEAAAIATRADTRVPKRKASAFQCASYSEVTASMLLRITDMVITTGVVVALATEPQSANSRMIERAVLPKTARGTILNRLANPGIGLVACSSKECRDMRSRVRTRCQSIELNL
jgi:hypothetical protein